MSRTTYIDLVLLNGELIRIECPSKYEGQLYDSIEHSMKLGDWWSTNRFEGCSATYLGLFLERVAMNKVVGIL
jgi:hypothetical protein